MRFKSLLCVCLLWAGGCASILTGQTAGTGALTGIVTDSSGASVANVAITVTNVDTGAQRMATTGADGSYTLGLLQPGTYRVRFVASGFKAAEVSSVTINVTETPVLNRSLEVGVQTEQITVQEVAETVQTTNATLGTVVNSASLTGLPLNTRNYTNILALSAGANAGVNNATALGKGSQNIAVNGATQSQNNFMMDGASIMVFGSQGNTGEAGSYAGLGIPSPDALAEFKIQTSLYDAGYGRNPGANVNVVTKSGTNALHGTAFEFFRNTDLNANDFFLNRAGLARPILNQNQFGGVIGGPIKKDKLFFFFSYQATKQKNGAAPQSLSSGVVLPALPIGDRSNTAALRAALGNLYSGKKGQFGGIAISPDGSNINPVALNILQAKVANGGYLIPSSPTGVQQSFPFSVPAIYNEYQYMGNVDYMLGSRHTFASRYFFTTDPQTADFVAGCNNNCLPGTGAKFIFTTTSLNEKVTSILTNNLVNEARFSLLRSLTNDTTNVTNTAQSVGIKPLNSLLPVNGTTGPSPIPVMVVQGLFQAGGSNFDFQTNSVTQFQYSDQLSWTHGKHTVRAGFEYERVRWNWNFASLGKGQLIFASFPDFLLGLPGCTPGNTTCNASNPGATNGSPFSNINATVLASRLSTAGLVHAYRATDSAAFVNEDYKVNSRLTVNLGLRWEFDGLVMDKYGNLTSVFPTEILKVAIPGNTPATGSFAGYVVPANYKDSANPPLPSGVLVNSQNIAPRNSTPLNNFAPRFGFAWQPGSGNKFVVRGGFGMFYNRIPGDSFIHSVQEAQPYSTPAGKGGPSNYFSSLAQPFAAGSLGWSLPRWVDLTTGNGSGISQTTVQEIFVTPVTYSWNLNAQYEFLPSWVLEVGYVGSHGIHQNNTHPINTAQLASLSNPLYGIVTTNTRSNVPARVPYLGFGASGLSQESTDGDYKFNSLQATVRKQLSHGLTFQAAYTFSRAFANYAASTNSGRISNDPLDSRQQYGLNANYRPHRFVLSYNWDIPTGKISGFAEKLIGGWSLSGLTTIQDGQPLTLTDTRGGTIYGQPGTSRAQINPGFTYADVLTSGDVKANLNNYFNKAALGLTPVIGDGTGWGNTGVGIAFGPGQFDWDIALAKRTRVGGLREAAELQFRAEAFNLFNHAQFSNPGLAVNQGNFGLITGSSVNPRLLQLALKYVF